MDQAERKEVFKMNGTTERGPINVIETYNRKVKVNSL